MYNLQSCHRKSGTFQMNRAELPVIFFSIDHTCAYLEKCHTFVVVFVK